ncbi:HlyD family secretion protein [Gynuella sp.]|uniref:HlyD family secretion protein n=1 Tax=Gynuella sp. TaxID=2969146 RepID=UPI003D09F100
MSDTPNYDTKPNIPSARHNPLKRILLMIVVPVIALVAGGGIYLKGGQSVETDNAYVKADMVAISSEVSGTIRRVEAQENQPVKAGDLLFEIDPETFNVAVQQAKAQLAQVKTQLAALKVSYAQKQAELKLAQSRYDYALAEEKRNEDLLKKHFISSSQFDAVKQDTRIANLQLIAANEGLKQILENLGGSIDLPIEQHPDYLAAQAQLDQAQLNLAHTRIKAPIDGIVRIPPKKGQFITAGQSALALVQNHQFWIEANYPEKDLTYVKPGQMVEIHVDTYPNVSWKGTVESLSPGTSSEFSILPAQNGTGNWVKVAQRVPVRIRIQEDQNTPNLRAGLSTIVAIKTGHKRNIMGFSL